MGPGPAPRALGGGCVAGAPRPGGCRLVRRRRSSSRAGATRSAGGGRSSPSPKRLPSSGPTGRARVLRRGAGAKAPPVVGSARPAGSSSLAGAHPSATRLAAEPAALKGRGGGSCGAPSGERGGGSGGQRCAERQGRAGLAGRGGGAARGRAGRQWGRARPRPAGAGEERLDRA